MSSVYPLFIGITQRNEQKLSGNKLPSRVHLLQYGYCFNGNTSNHFSGHTGIDKRNINI